MRGIVSVADEHVRALLPIYLLNAGADHKQEPRRRPNGADFYQFLYIAKGTGRYHGPDGSFSLCEGMTVFTAKGSPAAYCGDTADFRTGWVAFDGKEVNAILTCFSAEEVAVLKSEEVRTRISDIYKRASKNASPESLSAGVYDLIVTFFGELNEGRKPPKLLCAKAYIEEEFARDLSVSDVAQAVGISESLLYRIFREEEKTTPMDFLRGVRIRKAKELLLETQNLGVAEIAARTGFSDAAYFCKIFKSETGMTARTYRARYML